MRLPRSQCHPENFRGREDAGELARQTCTIYPRYLISRDCVTGRVDAVVCVGRIKDEIDGITQVVCHAGGSRATVIRRDSTDCDGRHTVCRQPLVKIGFSVKSRVGVLCHEQIVRAVDAGLEVVSGLTRGQR